MEDNTQTQTSPEGTPEAGQQPETTQSKTYSEAEFKEVVQQRQELKKKLAAFETAEQEKARKLLEEKGEYETVLKQKDSELESFKSKAEQYEKFVNEIKEDLLSQLSKEHQEIASVLGLEELRKYVKLNAKTPAVSTDVTRAGGNWTVDLNGKTWDDLTREELLSLKKSANHKYQALFKAKYGHLPN